MYGNVGMTISHPWKSLGTFKAIFGNLLESSNSFQQNTGSLQNISSKHVPHSNESFWRSLCYFGLTLKCLVPSTCNLLCTYVALLHNSHALCLTKENWVFFSYYTITMYTVSNLYCRQRSSTGHKKREEQGKYLGEKAQF